MIFNCKLCVCMANMHIKETKEKSPLLLLFFSCILYSLLSLLLLWFFFYPFLLFEMYKYTCDIYTTYMKMCAVLHIERLNK